MDLNEQTLSKPLGTPTGRDALETPVILVDDPKVQDGAAKSQRSSSKLRWLVLILACLSAFGNYFCFDNPTALSEALKERVKNKPPFSTKMFFFFWVALIECTFALISFILCFFKLEYNLLYSLYSFPNMVLPLFGGVFIDRVGVNTGKSFILLPQQQNEGGKLVTWTIIASWRLPRAFRPSCWYKI